MKRTLFVSSPCVALLVALGACVGGGGTFAPTDEGPFDLRIQGDASFQGPHGGHSIAVAVVGITGGTVVAQNAGTVSRRGDVAFSFTFFNVLAGGFRYEVHYWIDSNDGGGSAGVCHPAVNDHQGSFALSVEENIGIPLPHIDNDQFSVCSIF